MPVFDEEAWKRSGGTRIPRPQRVETCAQCGAPLGHHYPQCPACFHAIEDIWLADWAALLEREGIQAGSEDETLLAQVVMAESQRHPWTVVDIAMSLLRCESCGNELGSHYQTCTECSLAFGYALASEFGISANSHALHIGRWVLRHRHQHSANSVTAWGLTTPRVLTGWLPSTAEAQRIMALIKAGRMDEVLAGIEAVDQQINSSS